ncbi:MAG: right-handed parallel beta-helix repeat-containing protein [Candidatus Hodarchaeales archaeon]|jgi:parallel beta-helix repeat protein
MKAKKFIIILLVIGLIATLFFQVLSSSFSSGEICGTTGFESDGSINTGVNTLKTMKITDIGNKKASLTSHAPISIFSNDDFSLLGFPGAGTADDPYRIEGLEITASSGTLISIIDTTAHFRISDNLLDGLSAAEHGLWLYNVKHGTVENNDVLDITSNAINLAGSSNNVHVSGNTVSNNFIGIYLYGVSNNFISGNYVSDSEMLGIGVEKNFDDLSNIVAADNNIIDSNVVSNGFGGGIWFGHADNNTISNNILLYNDININGNHNTVINNTVSGNSGAGICLGGANYNTLLSNYLSNNGDGISLEESDNNMLANNTIFNNKKIEEWSGGGGLGLGGNNNIISSNSIHDCDTIGIWTVPGTTGNTITGNTVYNNKEVGILIEASRSTTLSSNTVHGNKAQGIWVGESSVITIRYNIVTSNGRDSGINLYSTSDSEVTGNLVHDSPEIGILLEKSVNNNISHNIITRNAEHGIRLVNWRENGNEKESTDNTVKYNVFYENNGDRKQALDGGSRNAFLNNYYSDLTGPDTNGDGIVDDPYNIEGSAFNQDPAPLAKPETSVLIPLTLIYPNRGIVLTDTVNIQWTTYMDMASSEVTYNIYYSTDNGYSWIQLVSNLTVNSYQWDTEHVNGTNCLIKVTAKTSEGLIAEDLSDSYLSIQNGGSSSTILTITENNNPTEPSKEAPENNKTEIVQQLIDPLLELTSIILIGTLAVIITVAGLRKGRRPRRRRRSHSNGIHVPTKKRITCDFCGTTVEVGTFFCNNCYKNVDSMTANYTGLSA